MNTRMELVFQFSKDTFENVNSILSKLFISCHYHGFLYWNLERTIYVSVLFTGEGMGEENPSRDNGTIKSINFINFALTEKREDQMKTKNTLHSSQKHP